MKRTRENTTNLPDDAMIIEAAIAGASLNALGAVARFRELLYDGVMLQGPSAPIPSASAVGE
jgi:hypothetical protein